MINIILHTVSTGELSWPCCTMMCCAMRCYVCCVRLCYAMLQHGSIYYSLMCYGILFIPFILQYTIFYISYIHMHYYILCVYYLTLYHQYIILDHAAVLAVALRDVGAVLDEELHGPQANATVNLIRLWMYVLNLIIYLCMLSEYTCQ